MNIGGADRAPKDDGQPQRPVLRPVPPPSSPPPAGSEAPATPSGPPRLTPVPPPRLVPAPPKAQSPAAPPPIARVSAPVSSAPSLSADAVTPVPAPAAPAPDRARLTLVKGGQLAAIILRKLEERRRAIGANGPRVARSLIVASALMLVIFIMLVLLLPRAEQTLVEVKLPEPRVTILPEPTPEIAPPPLVVATAPVMVPDVVSTPSSEPLEQPRLMRRRPVDPDAGKVGRERARQATSELAKSTAALDQALGDLSASLGATRGEVTTRRARRRDVGSGRSDGQLAGLERGVQSGGADVGGSAVEGKMVALGSLASSGATSTEEAGSSGGAAAPGVYRSNASLLAVIQKYAPGIQYCYESELKRDPGKRGKLVVSMTVAANGSVAEATVLQNTLGSERLASCALSQIRDWKFPAISGGMTTFQAPFLFTPPE